MQYSRVEEVRMKTPKEKPITETGQVPRYEPLIPKFRESPPPSLPEMDDPHGTTGIVRIVSESRDIAKDEDDTPATRR